MDKLKARKGIMQEAKKRVSDIKFGDPVTNVCAGHPSMRHAYFVGLGSHRLCNTARCTDKEGNFWDFGIEVVYPGHLAQEDSCALFRPIHALLS